MRYEDLLPQFLLQRLGLLQHSIHHIHQVHSATFTFSLEFFCCIDRRFSAVIPGPLGVTSEEVIKTLGSQHNLVSTHHKLKLLGPRVDEGVPSCFNSYERSVLDPHPHPLAVAGLSRLAKVCKSLCDHAKVVRMDALEDALSDDVLVEEADEGDCRGVEPAEGVVGLLLRPEEVLPNPSGQGPIFQRLCEGAVDGLRNDEKIFAKLALIHLRVATQTSEKR